MMLAVTNQGSFALNGTQAVFTLPDGVQYVNASGGDVTVNGSIVVVSLGRLGVGDTATAQLSLAASNRGALRVRSRVRSATAMPVEVEFAEIVVMK